MKIGKIYKIIYIGNENINITYIGSTFNTLRDRWKHHKGDYNKYLKDDHLKVAIYPYFKKYDIDNFKIFLIKEYEVIDRLHLLSYEQLYMNKIKNINKCKAFQPLHKIRNQIFKNENQNKIKNQNQKWKDNNKDKIHEYYVKNINKKKKYYEDNKKKQLNRQNLKIICECGISISKGNIISHKKTKRHNDNIFIDSKVRDIKKID